MDAQTQSQDEIRTERRGNETSDTIQLMNSLLADQFVLLVKSLNYHWNVEGMNFAATHKLLEDVYREIFEQIDRVAERIRALGGRPIGTIQSISDGALLNRSSDASRNGPLQMLQDLLTDVETVNQDLRNAIAGCEDASDYGTVDVLTGILSENEKRAWMLRATIQQ